MHHGQHNTRGWGKAGGVGSSSDGTSRVGAGRKKKTSAGEGGGGPLRKKKGVISNPKREANAGLEGHY